MRRLLITATMFALCLPNLVSAQVQLKLVGAPQEEVAPESRVPSAGASSIRGAEFTTANPRGRRDTVWFWLPNFRSNYVCLKIGSADGRFRHFAVYDARGFQGRFAMIRIQTKYPLYVRRRDTAIRVDTENRPCDGDNMTILVAATSSTLAGADSVELTIATDTQPRMLDTSNHELPFRCRQDPHISQDYRCTIPRRSFSGLVEFVILSAPEFNGRVRSNATIRLFAWQ